MLRAILVLTCFISSCASIKHKGVCGHPDDYPSSVTTTIKLKKFDNAPSFYFASHMFVIFISPQNMENYINKVKITNPELPATRLINDIKKDLKLSANKDLLQYNFETWNAGILIESLVFGLAEQGNVSIVAPGGLNAESITVLHDRQPAYINGIIYVGEKGVNAILSERECIAD